MSEKCPHCGHAIPAFGPRHIQELRYMIGKGWIWGGTLVDQKWKNDPDQVRYVENGWVEMDPKLGFRITEKGIDYATGAKRNGWKRVEGRECE